MASFTLPTILCIAVLSSMTWAYDYYQGQCHQGWEYFNNRCFKYFANKKTWIDAEQDCVLRGGNLVAVCCDKENDYFKQLQQRSGGNGPFWIGLTDIHKEGAWIWSDGSSVHYTKWNNREPNNVRNEDCVHSNFGGEKNWNDISCDAKYEYICAQRNCY